MVKPKLIYIYHIPGKKVGVTRNLNKRVSKQQGYKIGEYEILFQSEDIEEISRKEREFQRKFGYSTDMNNFSKIQKQNKKGMNINTTEQTTTFPIPMDGLANYLQANKGWKWNSPHGSHILDTPTIAWIEKNARVSHFNPNRTYVYNKSLASFDEEKQKEEKFAPVPAQPESIYGWVFDKIRIWASVRGIYEKGDSKTQCIKLVEEQGELARAILKRDKTAIKDSIGDMVVVLTNLAHLEGYTIEDCIESAYDEIRDRKGAMVNGTFAKATL